MIRKINTTDRDAVIEILHSTNMFTPAEVTVAVELIDIYLTNSFQKDYEVVILESESFQVVGFMIFGPAPLTDGVYDLYWIAVHPCAQDRGHGRELILWLDRYLQSIHARMVLVETSSSVMYKPTREFYHAMDFKEVSCIRDFYKPGDDRITYLKYVKKKEIKKHRSVAGTL